MVIAKNIFIIGIQFCKTYLFDKNSFTHPVLWDANAKRTICCIYISQNYLAIMATTFTISIRRYVSNYISNKFSLGVVYRIKMWNKRIYDVKNDFKISHYIVKSTIVISIFDFFTLYMTYVFFIPFLEGTLLYLSIWMFMMQLWHHLLDHSKNPFFLLQLSTSVMVFS